MIKKPYYLFFLLVGCKEPSFNKYDAQESDSSSNISSNQIEETLRCDTIKYSFTNLVLNGIPIEKIKTEKKLKAIQNFDSVGSDHYHYYGKSHILLDDGEIIAIFVLDTNLYFNNLISSSSNLEELKSMYPCIFKNELSNDTIWGIPCKRFTLFDRNSNKLTYYFTNEKILAVWYNIDEWRFIP